MSTQRPVKDEIFHAAAELADADERAAYVEVACGQDLALRAEIHELLKHNDAKDSLFDRSPAGLGSTFDQPPLASPGMRIGPYKLIEQIGEGGMGLVFVAEQHEPVRRKVALKLIKAGLDSRQVIARFEAERQALALMDHPNIAKVLDAGMTGESVRPYFVMELVKGVPITHYCDEHRLTPRQRLELFVPVCHAIQHAHHKGIIHRDIKPSNVLVARYDDKPVPKIIDFGVAKATGQQLTEQTLNTGFGAVVGTFEYMSPEQASFNQLDIDTRSDIYSLGVLLYELLAGSPPFNRKDLERAGLLEMLRVIREQEPSKPSIKLSSSDALPTLSANRATEPAKLTKLVRGELDWIVMMALEKDRGRRYETANGFAADVLHYLADEPVSACPPSAAYRLRKFVRRNRAAVLTAAAVVVALLGGTAIATWQAVRAQRAEARSRVAEAHTQRSLRETQQAEAHAQRSLRETQQVVDRYLSVIRDSDELRARGREPLLEKLLEPARETYEKLVLQEESDEPGVQAERARIYGRLGKVYHAAGRFSKSEETYRKALSITVELAAAHPDDVQYQNDLAVTWNNLGNCLNDFNQFEKAQEAYAQAAGLYRKLLEANPSGSELFDFPRELAECLYNLADLHFRHGDLGNAEQLYGQALVPVKNRDAHATPESLNVLGRIYTGLGGVYERTGRKEQVGEVFQKALSVREQLTRRRPSVPEYRRNLALSAYNLGTWFQNDKRWEQARDAYRSALGPLQFLIREYPSVPEHQVDLARIHNNLGIAWTQAAPKVTDAAEFAQAKVFYAEAEKAYVEALRIRRELVRGYPDGPEYQQKLADSLRNLGMLYFVRTQGLVQLGRTSQALPDWERFLAEVRELPESGSVKGETLFGLANHVAWPIKFVGDDEGLKDAYAEQALRLLKRARLAGYFNDPVGRQQLQEHPRLDRLRQRPNFQQFLDEVLDLENELDR